MDRRNGGDPLAPPRPPKLLPRVHRPRAPEPETMMSGTTIAQTHSADRTTNSATATATAPQCTNSNRQQPHLNSNNNPSQQQQQQQHQQQRSSSITTTAPATTTNLNNNNTNNIHNHSNSSSSSNHRNNNNVAALTSPAITTTTTTANTASQSDFEDYQIHHLTFLPQRPSSLSRNSSHVSTISNSTTSSSITAASTFTRRQPPPPAPGAAVPLLIINTGSSSSSSSHQNNTNTNSNSLGLGIGIGNISSIGSSLLSHFHSADPVPGSPVTLAQPRPESERLTNEYVDTPLRTAAQQLQLQHATRAQHPAGQHDNGQTTTHHLLLLPQRELRQHQQHQQQQQQHQQHQHHQQHSNRLAGTAGSATVTAGTDGTDGFSHSHNHKSPLSAGAATTTTTTAATATATSLTTCPLTGKVIAAVASAPHGRAAGVGSFASAAAQPITQPITKQPALSAASANNSCKFAKDLPALDELLGLHNIATGIATPQGMVSAVNGASPLGTPIVIGGDPASLNPITCPRCERCRCEQCQSPRPLPHTWLCKKTCLCSAESVIDYASCLCCVKALFYHCACDNDMDCDDGSGTPSCVDNPCSCGPYKRTQRWGWLGAMSLVLPCLWCYWPMRGCASLFEKCYGRYAGRGCRCQQIGSTSSMLPIVQLGVNGGGMMGGGGNGVGMAQNGGAGGQMAVKSMAHHHHHSECSNAASRILRKGDLTPEKRLLDSSPEY